jgi:3-oxoacyl-[acyl-carrier protein] reductase
MRIRFDGKTVVVSGAGHGFGRCIAETFAQLGARVFGCDLSAAELAETAKAGVAASVLVLTDRAAAAARIAQIERTTGGAVDVLVTTRAAAPDRRCARSRTCRTPIGTIFSR